ncbi:hypothetical protein [Desulforamulus ferrireducens]|uniref:hypothetical protein n=1 Tax=Desulforamulus ferrireducens TaxID=1833852 RepID=UPI0011EA5C7D|nr:hypothetical protein [Desulforamulus ferrireducens]
MAVVGERGSGSNAFSLFLILILLYFAQKDSYANVYMENINTKEQPDQDENPLEEKLAVGLSNGEVQEYMPDETVHYQEEQTVVDFVSLDGSVVEEPVEQEAVEETWEDTYELAEEYFTTDMDVEENENLEELPVDTASEVEPEVDIEESVQEQDEEFTSGDSVEEMPTEIEASDEVTEEQPEVSGAEEFTEAEESQQIDAEEPIQITEEPILGGQDKLFLKPVINDIKIKKVEHTGPKITIRFGS